MSATTQLTEARHYEKLSSGRVRCTLCPHDCKIADRHLGACGVRFQEDGVLYTLVYDRVISRCVDPIEKKPFFHFQPGSRSYSIATEGCNLRCTFCQNWEISQGPKGPLPRGHGPDTHPICPQLREARDRIHGERIDPQAIVSAALDSGARSIAYTYTEPTIFYELAHDTAQLARDHGLRNVSVSNGFTSPQVIREIAPFLDAANIDLKFFDDAKYRRICNARLQPVLDAIALYHELGVWVEVTTLVIPDLNDSTDELRSIAHFVHSLDREIPWHVSQFYPAYQMQEGQRTPIDTLRRARDLGLETGLCYVYGGNVPGQEWENTFCPGCSEGLIRRWGHHVCENLITNGKCPGCGRRVAGVDMDGYRS